MSGPPRCAPACRRSGRRYARVVNIDFPWPEQGCLGRREGPVFGRDVETAQLWRALVDVARARKAGMVAVTGPIGVGKTRLMQWLARRAYELGGIRGLTVHGDLLVEGVADYLGVTGLEDEASLKPRLRGAAGVRGRVGQRHRGPVAGTGGV